MRSQLTIVKAVTAVRHESRISGRTESKPHPSSARTLTHSHETLQSALGGCHHHFVLSLSLSLLTVLCTVTCFHVYYYYLAHLSFVQFLAVYTNLSPSFSVMAPEVRLKRKYSKSKRPISTNLTLSRIILILSSRSCGPWPIPIFSSSPSRQD
jgi:hypothetical protein